MSDSNPMGSASSGRAPSTNPDALKLKRDVSAPETQQLNVEIPRPLHKRLKMYSVRTEQEMRKITARALRADLAEKDKA